MAESILISDIFKFMALCQTVSNEITKKELNFIKDKRKKYLRFKAKGYHTLITKKWNVFRLSPLFLFFIMAIFFSNMMQAQIESKNDKPKKIGVIDKNISVMRDNVIFYPASSNIKYLKRFHYAYIQSLHAFDKDYLDYKYYTSFTLPHNIVKGISYTVPPREVNGHWSKPIFKSEWFSPKIFIVNLNTGTRKQSPINLLALRGVLDYKVPVLFDGLGQYEIQFEQTFPNEEEFRQKIKNIYVFDSEESSPDDEEKRNADINLLVEEYRNILGKKTETPIYRFSANYDFLVASIGDSYAAGEGNPMECGKDLPEYGILDPIIEVYRDLKEASKNTLNDLSDGEFQAAYKDYLKMFAGPAIEQVFGACKITTLNIVGLTEPNFDVKPIWIENGLESDKSKTSRSYINPTAPAAFKVEDKYKGIAVTYLNFASSGATSENLYSTNQHGYQKVSQIDELAKNLENSGNREIDALTIAIGANDIAFSSIMGDLISDEARFVLKKIPIPAVAIALAMTSGKSKDEINKTISEDLAKLEAKFDLLDQKIKSKLKVKQVFLLEYPNAQFTYSENGIIKIGPGCGVLNLRPITFTQEEANIINDAGTKLNNKLKSLAEKHNWVFVSGATQAFLGHGYCTEPNISYFRAAETSCGCQGNFQGMLHPNAKGFSEIQPLVLANFENSFPFSFLQKGLHVEAGVNKN